MKVLRKVMRILLIPVVTIALFYFIVLVTAWL